MTASSRWAASRLCGRLDPAADPAMRSVRPGALLPGICRDHCGSCESTRPPADRAHRAAEPERLRGDVATGAEKTKGLRLSCSSCLHLAGLRHHRYHLSSTTSSMPSAHQFRDIMRWVTSQPTADGTAMVKECNLSRWVRWIRLSVNCCRISTMTHYTTAPDHLHITVRTSASP